MTMGNGNPPMAKKVSHLMEMFGDVKVDNYYRLRDDSRSNPELLSYLKQENHYAHSIMSDTKKFEDDLYAEIRGRIKEDDVSAPVRRGAYYYYHRTLEGKQHVQYCRRAVPNPDAPPSVHDTMPDAPHNEHINLGPESLLRLRLVPITSRWLMLRILKEMRFILFMSLMLTLELLWINLLLASLPLLNGLLMVMGPLFTSPWIKLSALTRHGYIHWERSNQVIPVFITKKMIPFLLIFKLPRARSFCLLLLKVKIQASTFILMFQSLKMDFKFSHLV